MPLNARCSSLESRGLPAAAAEDQPAHRRRPEVGAGPASCRRLRRPAQPPPAERLPLAAPAGPLRGLRRRHRPPGLRGVRRRRRGAAPARRGRTQRAHARRGLPAPVPPAYEKQLPPALWHRTSTTPRSSAAPTARSSARPSARSPTSGASTRSTPSSTSSSSTAAPTALAHHDRQPPPGAARPVGGRPRRADRLLRRRRPPPQHGLLQLRLRLLRRVHDASRGPAVPQLEAAVHRLTGELGDWFGLDAGTLRVGDRADIAVVDPAGLDGESTPTTRRRWPAFGGLCRMVRRNDAAVAATFIAGSVVFRRASSRPATARPPHRPVPAGRSEAPHRARSPLAMTASAP